jgi:hypothetical protein
LNPKFDQSLKYQILRHSTSTLTSCDTEKNEKHHADKMWALCLACSMGEELQSHSMSTEIIKLADEINDDVSLKRKFTVKEKRLLSGEDNLPIENDDHQQEEQQPLCCRSTHKKLRQRLWANAGLARPPQPGALQPISEEPRRPAPTLRSTRAWPAAAIEHQPHRRAAPTSTPAATPASERPPPRNHRLPDERQRARNHVQRRGDRAGAP